MLNQTAVYDSKGESFLLYRFYLLQDVPGKIGITSMMFKLLMKYRPADNYRAAPRHKRPFFLLFYSYVQLDILRPETK